MQRIWKISLYLLSVCVFLVVGLELLLRAVYPDPDHHWDYRFLFFSPNRYQNLDEEIWTYRPHKTIREVAVYGVPSLFPPAHRLVVEYDCLMRSNNLGLIQDDDIEPGTAVTVIIGDSFTEGQGGCPWFARLQSRRTNERIVNAGLMGTGVAQWSRMITHLRQRGLIIKRILVIAISEDFKRPAKSWSKETLDCLDDGICPANGFWATIGINETHSEIIKKAAERFSLRFPSLKSIDFVQIYFKQNSHVFKFTSKAMQTVRGIITGANTASGILPETEAALESLKDLMVPIRVLMVPQRMEAGLLGMHPDSRRAIDVLNSYNFTYSWCHLSGRDFLPNDGHPNRAGYDKIVACADNALSHLE